MELSEVERERKGSAIMREVTRRNRRDRYEADFGEFLRAAWPTVDNTDYQSCWALDGLCEHLQAVTEGQIDRLLVNFPPRSGKTLTTSICWPAWTWARAEKNFRSGAGVRFLCGSYNHDLSLANSNTTRRLIASPWYQKYWDERFVFMSDMNTKTKFDSSAGGSRHATSVGGSLLGIGGDILIIDDPHNTAGAESDADRAKALEWWRELSSTRLNDPNLGAIVVIMQRLHEEDVSGRILASERNDWVHYCVPMHYDWRRHCVSVLGWEDPRGLDANGESLVTVAADGERLPRDEDAASILDNERQGALMWPERFDAASVKAMEDELGPYAASGRLEQMPVPGTGGILQRDWWKLWESADGKFPKLDFIVASLDGAFTEKEENDPSGFTVWGVWTNEEGWKRVVLLNAWSKHLPFSGPRADQAVRESWAGYKRRVGAKWGLLEWVVDGCRRFEVNKLLIEAKGPGISAAQELRNRYGMQDWDVELVQVKGDKVSRALAVQPTFSQGVVYAPARDWAESVIKECSVFPKGRHDDLVDSTVMALRWIRDMGLLATDAEVKVDRDERVTLRSSRAAAPLYPACG